MDIWFQDEARIGQQGTITRLWARKGTRPRVIRQRQYAYAYLFGAVCPSRDEAVALILPAVNIKTMQLHLQEISKQVPDNRHAVVVVDRAGWHTSQKVNVYPNITLVTLPAASPELNPTEQVWQCLRDNHLANRCYADYEDIIESCSDAWNSWTSKPGRIKNLCTRDWAKLVI